MISVKYRYEKEVPCFLFIDLFVYLFYFLVSDQAVRHKSTWNKTGGRKFTTMIS